MESILPKLEKHLLRVKTPAQYLGGEMNAITREWTDDRVRFALCFPDAYTIGMSNQGFRILYHVINELHDGILCERVFAPWLDLEAIMREENIPLFALESHRPVSSFDALGFSLQNETSYSNLLNMLDLSGLTLRTENRDDAHPIVIAGGTGAMTPEPLSDFVDMFLPGEGEEVLPCILHLIGVWRGRHNASVLDQYRVPLDFDRKDVFAKRSFTIKFAYMPENLSTIRDMTREEFLTLCARTVPGCYVPSQYELTYDDSGVIADFTPRNEGVPKRIKKNTLDNLNEAYYPIRQVIPYVEVVQNRVTIEIMRGCTEGCRYCQAGMIDRPQRYRTPEKVLELAKALVEETGYDEISLLSLSSSDHPQLADMIRLLQAEFSGRHISVALPSLRVDQQLTWLPGLTKNVRKSGLTLAPETGSERLRRVINKTITQHDLREGARTALEEGYRTIKFYMMLGLPTETEDDILESAALLNEIAQMAKDMGKKSLNLNVTASLFVPKSHTPFQWDEMATREKLERHSKLLRKSLKHKSIKLKVHGYTTSWLEGIFSRGDRRLGRVIETAWRNGARFDAWDECAKIDIWQNAMVEAGLDPDFYIHREKTKDEYLPWEMISVGTSKKHFWDERVRSRLEEYTQDCSGHTPGCIACGVDPLTCRTGLEQEHDQMTPDMQRRAKVLYADSFKERLADKDRLQTASNEFFSG